MDLLLAFELPDCSIEVIVVVDETERLKSKINTQNQQTIEEFHIWKKLNAFKLIEFHLIEVLSLSKKYASEELVQKIGMDEASRRLVSIDQMGSIISLNADRRVSNTYFKAIY